MKAIKIKKNISINDFIILPFYLLSWMGVRLFFWHPNDCKTKRERICFGILIFNIIFGVGGVYAAPLNGEITTVKDYIAYAIYMIFGGNSMVKLATEVLGRHKIEYIYKNLRKSFPQTQSDIELSKLHECYKETLLKNHGLAYFHLAVTSMFNIFPIAQSTLQYLFGDGEFIYRYPIFLTVPFNTERPFTYLIAYLYHCIGTYSASFIILSADLLLLASLRLICMNFELLTAKILSFKPTGTKKDAEEFKKLSNFHKKLFM